VASRLTRWAGTTVAGGLAVVWLLLPSGESIYYESAPAGEGPGTRLEARQRAVGEASVTATWRIRRREDSAQAVRVIAEARARGEDPVVLGMDLKELRPVAQRRARELWEQLPVRDPGVRTVFSFSDAFFQGSKLPKSGSEVCISPVYWYHDAGSLERRIAATAGPCAAVEQFGVPGRAWRTWIDSSPPFPYSFRTGPRIARRENDEDEFLAWYSRLGLEWDLDRRALVACARREGPWCLTAFGVGETDSLGLRRSVFRRQFRDPLPAALYRDLGEEGFRRLWATDTTIAAEYAAIRGKPIDGLLRDLALATVGPQPRDIGLSPFAWLGALIWLGLFGAWAALRLQERRIG
jgi:hypothetical protein